MEGNRAALYLRLSKEDADKVSKGDDSASIRSQRLLLTDYALARQLQIKHVYSDDDESGLYDDRPGFEQMMTDAKMGEFDVILAKSQSRFSRNMEHIEKYLHHDLPNLGVRFIGVVDGVDTKEEENKKSRQINGLVNEWYCEDLSKNIRSAFRAKMRNGEFLGASCPYGYRKDPQNHNHLVVDAYAAKVVRRIFELYLSGYGKAKIGSILSSDGILIPTLYKREALGENYHNAKALETTRAWSYQTIHTILNNETYLGHLIQNKTNTLSYKDKKKKSLPKEEWIVVKNAHAPIIEPEVFALAQKLQKARTKSVGQMEQNGVFSGLIYCADCKHAMVRKYERRGGGGFCGYLCRTYKTQGKRFCGSHSIDYAALKEAVLHSLQAEAKQILTEGQLDALRRFQAEGEEEESCGLQLEKIERQMEKVGRFKKKTYQSYLEELISREEYISYVAEYDAKWEALKKQRELICGDSKLQRESYARREEWEEAFKDGIRITELTREVVLELIDRIEVGEDGEITIYYQFEHPNAP